MKEHMSQVRVRFAPSPTGYLHVGGLRSAYFNWLFARHYGGAFLIRIEDTDPVRSTIEFRNSQLASLEWCGITSDESLIIQSQRIAEYSRIAHDMVQAGKAYKCYCSPEELEQRLGPNAAEGTGYTKYDGICRNRTDQPENKPYAIRFKLPTTQSDIAVHDLIRGEVVFPADILDDFIILRSDGNPMYNFSVVIDDAFMRISHVIRGEEHLVNTPKQLLLYQALGYKVPQFAHVPLILGSDGTKLSKRDAAVSVIEYKNDGYLAEALCNYLVRLGWAHGDQEIFTREELITLFSLQEVGKKGAIFDLTKLTWMNGVYMRKHDALLLVQLIVRDIDPYFRTNLVKWSDEQLYGLLNLYKERTHTLRELATVLEQLYQDPSQYTSGNFNMTIKDLLQELLEKLQLLSVWDRSHIEQLIKQICVEHSLKLPELAQPIRYALTGSTASPSVYDLCVFLQKDTVIRRISLFKDAL